MCNDPAIKTDMGQHPPFFWCFEFTNPLAYQEVEIFPKALQRRCWAVTKVGEVSRETEKSLSSAFNITTCIILIIFLYSPVVYWHPSKWSLTSGHYHAWSFESDRQKKLMNNWKTKNKVHISALGYSLSQLFDYIFRPQILPLFGCEIGSPSMVGCVRCSIAWHGMV